MLIADLVELAKDVRFKVVSVNSAAVIQVCDREGRACHARETLRSPGLSCHGGALDEAARLLSEAETDKQPPGPFRTRKFTVLLSLRLFNFVCG